MKGVFFWRYYESAFFVSRNYRCNTMGGVGLDDFLLLGFWEGYYESAVQLNKPILREIYLRI